MSDDIKKRMLEWHKATVEYSLVGGELPEWAASISGKDATPEDCIRLKQEANLKMLYGNGGHGPVKGIIDFTSNATPTQLALTEDVFSKYLEGHKVRIIPQVERHLFVTREVAIQYDVRMRQDSYETIRKPWRSRIKAAIKALNYKDEYDGRDYRYAWNRFKWHLHQRERMVLTDMARREIEWRLAELKPVSGYGIKITEYGK